MEDFGSYWKNTNIILIELLLVCCAMAGEVCLYSYRYEHTERTAYVYCPTACCGKHGGFICCVKGSYYKYFNKYQKQYQNSSNEERSPEAVAAIVTGSLVGFLVFVGIVVVLYCDYTRKLIWFKQKTCIAKNDEVSSKNGLFIVCNEEERSKASAPVQEACPVVGPLASDFNMMSNDHNRESYNVTSRFIETDFL